MNRHEMRTMIGLVSIEYRMTGSRAICNPPPDDTDEDYIALVTNMHSLDAIGLTQTSDSEYSGGSWMTTWRVDEFNVVATESREFYDRFVAATLLAKERNLTEKSERIALFQRVLYAPIDYIPSPG